MTSPDDSHLQFLFLLSDVAWLMRRDFHAHIQGLKMTPTQTRALAVIARREGLTQTALAQRLEVQPMSVVRLLDRMEKAGVVKRQKDPEDRRAIRLYLTPKAKPVLQKLWAVGEVVREHGLLGLTGADEQKLITLLQTLKTNYACENDAGLKTRAKDKK